MCKSMFLWFCHTFTSGVRAAPLEERQATLSAYITAGSLAPGVSGAPEAGHTGAAGQPLFPGRGVRRGGREARESSSRSVCAGPRVSLVSLSCLSRVSLQARAPRVSLPALVVLKIKIKKKLKPIS